MKDFCLEFDTPLVCVLGKGNYVRALPLMDKTDEHFKQYLSAYHPHYPQNGDEPLFYTTIRRRKQSTSADNVSVFIKRYASLAKNRCPEIPDKIHAHLFRHSRATHLYQSGIPLSVILSYHLQQTVRLKIFLVIYVQQQPENASADTTMIRQALEKAVYQGNVTSDLPIWADNEDMILKLCDLK